MGKGVLFREVSSVQGFYCRGVHCIKVECYVTLLCFQGKGNYACNQRGSSTSAFEVTPASVSVVSGYLVCVYVCMCVYVHVCTIDTSMCGQSIVW